MLGTRSGEGAQYTESKSKPSRFREAYSPKQPPSQTDRKASLLLLLLRLRLRRSLVHRYGCSSLLGTCSIILGRRSQVGGNE